MYKPSPDAIRKIVAANSPEVDAGYKPEDIMASSSVVSDASSDDDDDVEDVTPTNSKQRAATAKKPISRSSSNVSTTSNSAAGIFANRKDAKPMPLNARRSIPLPIPVFHRDSNKSKRSAHILRRTASGESAFSSDGALSEHGMEISDTEKSPQKDSHRKQFRKKNKETQQAPIQDVVVTQNAAAQRRGGGGGGTNSNMSTCSHLSEDDTTEEELGNQQKRQVLKHQQEQMKHLEEQQRLLGQMQEQQLRQQQELMVQQRDLLQQQQQPQQSGNAQLRQSSPFRPIASDSPLSFQQQQQRQQQQNPMHPAPGQHGSHPPQQMPQPPTQMQAPAQQKQNAMQHAQKQTQQLPAQQKLLQVQQQQNQQHPPKDPKEQLKLRIQQAALKQQQEEEEEHEKQGAPPSQNQTPQPQQETQQHHMQQAQQQHLVPNQNLQQMPQQAAQGQQQQHAQPPQQACNGQPQQGQWQQPQQQPQGGQNYPPRQGQQMPPLPRSPQWQQTQAPPAQQSQYNQQQQMQPKAMQNGQDKNQAQMPAPMQRLQQPPPNQHSPVRPPQQQYPGNVGTALPPQQQQQYPHGNRQNDPPQNQGHQQPQNHVLQQQRATMPHPPQGGQTWSPSPQNTGQAQQGQQQQTQTAPGLNPSSQSAMQMQQRQQLVQPMSSGQHRRPQQQTQKPHQPPFPQYLQQQQRPSSSLSHQGPANQPLQQRPSSAMSQQPPAQQRFQQRQQIPTYAPQTPQTPHGYGQQQPSPMAQSTEKWRQQQTQNNGTNQGQSLSPLSPQRQTMNQPSPQQQLKPMNGNIQQAWTPPQTPNLQQQYSPQVSGNQPHCQQQQRRPLPQQQQNPTSQLGGQQAWHQANSPSQAQPLSPPSVPHLQQGANTDTKGTPDWLLQLTPQSVQQLSRQEEAQKAAQRHLLQPQLQSSQVPAQTRMQQPQLQPSHVPVQTQMQPIQQPRPQYNGGPAVPRKDFDTRSGELNESIGFADPQSKVALAMLWEEADKIHHEEELRAISDPSRTADLLSGVSAHSNRSNGRKSASSADTELQSNIVQAMIGHEAGRAGHQGMLLGSGKALAPAPSNAMDYSASWLGGSEQSYGARRTEPHVSMNDHDHGSRPPQPPAQRESMAPRRDAPQGNWGQENHAPSYPQESAQTAAGFHGGRSAHGNGENADSDALEWGKTEAKAQAATEHREPPAQSNEPKRAQTQAQAPTPSKKETGPPPASANEPKRPRRMALYLCICFLILLIAGGAAFAILWFFTDVFDGVIKPAPTVAPDVSSTSAPTFVPNTPVTYMTTAPSSSPTLSNSTSQIVPPPTMEDNATSSPLLSTPPALGNLTAQMNVSSPTTEVPANASSAQSSETSLANTTGVKPTSTSSAQSGEATLANTTGVTPTNTSSAQSSAATLAPTIVVTPAPNKTASGAANSTTQFPSSSLAEVEGSVSNAVDMRIQWQQQPKAIVGTVPGSQAGSFLATNANGTVIAVGFNATSQWPLLVYEVGENGEWEQLGPAINPAQSNSSTLSVALNDHGNVLAVGFSDGSVQGYEFINSSWAPRGNEILLAGTRSLGTVTSVALAADGLLLAASAYNRESDYLIAHRFLFNRADGAWVPVGEPIARLGALDDASVGLSADGLVMALCRVFKNDAGAPTSKVELYEAISYSYENWSGKGNVPAFNSGHIAVSLSGDGQKLAVTTDRASNVYVFSTEDNAWKAGSDRFVRGVDISLSHGGTRLAIANGSLVLSYQLRGSLWEAIAFGEASGFRDVSDGYGSSVVLSGNGEMLAVGAPYNDDGGRNTGKIYAYEAKSLAPGPNEDPDFFDL